MTIKRRDLLTGGAGIAAGMAAGGLSAPAQAQTDAIHWDREADVVVVGSGACGHARGDRGARGAARRSSWSRPKAISAATPSERRQRPAGRRHQRAEEIRHRGFARPAVSAI